MESLRDVLALLVVIGVVIYIAAGFIDVQREKKADKKAKEQKRVQDIAENERNLYDAKRRFTDEMADICGSTRLHSEYTRENAKRALHDMDVASTGLRTLGAEEDHFAIVEECRKEWGRLSAAEDRSKKVARQGMMDPERYGQVNKAFLSAVQTVPRQKVENLLRRCETLQEEGSLDAFTAIDPEKLLQTPWVFAMEKPYRAEDFNRSVDVCKWFFLFEPADVRMARWYAQQQMGGADAVEIGNVKECLDERLASCLMWLQAYRQEQRVLQEMLKENCTMSPKAQERFHALNNGGGKAPDTHEAVSGGDELSFDVSALSWRDEEYNALFESLAFQDKKLTYGLAVRDEDKDLLLPAGVRLPGKDEMLKKFQASLAEEYGGQATARNVTCVMLSGSGRETMEGVLVTSRECRQLGVAVNLARIGKKVNLKFYTLFLPDGLELAEQKQQAISLCKKMSPGTTMWENSLKSTMLLAIQQVLNSSAQGGSQQPDAPIPGGEGGAPVF